MRNLAFSIWMAGFAIAASLDPPRSGGEITDTIAALITLVVWFGIGKLLYEPREK